MWQSKSPVRGEAVTLLTHGAAATGTPFTRPNLHFPLLQDRTRRRENEWLWEEERESGKTREEAVSKRGHGPAMSGMLMTPVTWPSLNIDWSSLGPVDFSAHCSCPPDPGSVFSFREKTRVTYSSLRWTGCRSGVLGACVRQEVRQPQGNCLRDKSSSLTAVQCVSKYKG